MGGLADAMNQMAIQLKERIKTVTDQRNEIEAILSSMLEGVIAIDVNERILSMNQAAAKMLKIYLPDMKGRSIQEAIRNRDLHKFINGTLSDQKTMKGDITLHHDAELVLDVISTPLQSGSGSLIGALAVLNDVTQLRHLEKVRRDFVANVSHEVKTPLTAIKGFVETLSTGAIEQPKEARRFLGIIEKHVDRLAAIVEDLLHLSRIEQQDDDTDIQLEENPVRDVIRSSIQACQPKSDAKHVNIELVCDNSLNAPIDPHLLERAFVNLLDNAIKYSKEDHEVRIEAVRNDSEITVSFQDSGVGIEKKHLARLFERFYRVDPARSRQLGGTGLGLSIVKHIINGHGGHVEVESTPGKGSTFTVHIPVG
jgi:two-component system phosphate regulon sensor histidine kinase PhoR